MVPLANYVHFRRTFGVSGADAARFIEFDPLSIVDELQQFGIEPKLVCGALDGDEYKIDELTLRLMQALIKREKLEKSRAAKRLLAADRTREKPSPAIRTTSVAVLGVYLAQCEAQWLTSGGTGELPADYGSLLWIPTRAMAARCPGAWCRAAQEAAATLFEYCAKFQAEQQHMSEQQS
jgi:hypothetical protein